MTTKHIFHNFTEGPFTGYWNGKAYTFQPGVKKYYPKGIAEHFAKHLTNEILTKDGNAVYASPKKPLQVPAFMEIFNKACLLEEVADEDNLDIDELAPADEPSMNIKVEQKPAIDKYDASQNDSPGPGGKPQIIGGGAKEDNTNGQDENASTTESEEVPETPVVPNGSEESQFEGINLEDKK